MSYAWSGLVDWRVAALYILGGVAGGWIGARLATHLGKNKKALNWIFAVIVALTAIYMLYRNLAAFHL
ncbi:permease [mine drainage metagenome]|uniref:Permease n=1 Tax=mine drainage metagenome TaxID=410659 RepID=T1B9W3_9ZZZZ